MKLYGQIILSLFIVIPLMGLILFVVTDNTKWLWLLTPLLFLMG
jgi:hypothetical protein